MKINNSIETTPWGRICSLGNWSHTTENSRVSIRKEDLQWAIEELAKWQMVRDLDLDVSDPLEEGEFTIEDEL